MEFPHLGQHCSNAMCKQLGIYELNKILNHLVFNFFFSKDFLPFKCDVCAKVFW